MDATPKERTQSIIDRIKHETIRLRLSMKEREHNFPLKNNSILGPKITQKESQNSIDSIEPTKTTVAKPVRRSLLLLLAWFMSTAP